MADSGSLVDSFLGGLVYNSKIKQKPVLKSDYVTG